MALVKVRAASLFLQNKKAATIEGVEYEFHSGDEPVGSDLGGVGWTDGFATTRLTCTGFNPVPGSGLKLMQAINKKKDVEISLLAIDGYIHTVVMRCLTGKATSSHRTGMQASHYVFGGFEPSITKASPIGLGP